MPVPLSHLPHFIIDESLSIFDFFLKLSKVLGVVRFDRKHLLEKIDFYLFSNDLGVERLHVEIGVLLENLEVLLKYPFIICVVKVSIVLAIIHLINNTLLLFQVFAVGKFLFQP